MLVARRHWRISYRRLAPTAVLPLALAAGCATAVAPLPPATETIVPVEVPTAQVEPEPRPILTQTGVASWYGPGFHGRRTASGERFDERALTAAHRSLPFGALVEVRAVDGDGRVRVRINDRGPFVKGRIIDLSRAAAARLGISHSGLAEVELRLLEPRLEHWPERLFAVQVAAFATPEVASRYAAGLAREEDPGCAYYIVPPDLRSRFHRVRLGPFGDKSSARATAARLRARGQSTMLVQENMGAAPVTPLANVQLSGVQASSNHAR